MQGIAIMDVIELHDNVEHPSDYTSETPMYSDIPESLTADSGPTARLLETTGNRFSSVRSRSYFEGLHIKTGLVRLHSNQGKKPDRTGL
jgi:hypothetical protein